MPLFRLPRLQQGLPIVDGQGKPLASFLRWWNIDVLGKIEVQENQQNETLAAIQALQVQQAAQLEQINEALALAGFAVELADGAAGGTARSGSNSGIGDVINPAFAVFTQVDLLTVSAGDLTIPGTGPIILGTTAMTGGTVTNAEYQIVEVDNGVDNGAVFTGTFTVTDVTSGPGPQVFSLNHTSASAVSSFSDPRTTTGSISYRAEVKFVSGASLTDVGFYLFSRRS